jgi:WD repeat-containing protein 90
MPRNHLLQVFVGTENGSLGSLDITSHKYTTMLRSHSDSVNAVAIESSGEQVITGSSDGTIRVWNIETFQQLCAPPPQGLTCMDKLCDKRVCIQNS